ncbi:MAG: tRNA (adenosine(37)-N6)-dimethylallyltransferase MiaA [Patescibacteria group bacterium]
MLPKLIVILGPTASGKTDLALKIANEFNGEIISADSRQVYKKIGVGSAKPAGNWKTIDGKKRYLVEGVPHYAVDLVDPGQTFTVAEFQKLAFESIEDIKRRGKVPLLVGGTGLYIWSVVDNLKFPAGEPMKKLRDSFETKTLEELVVLLDKVDPDAVSYIDKKNKRRVIRALEVAISSGQSSSSLRVRQEPLFDCLQIGIRWPLDELYARIDTRIEEQWQAGWQDEVEKLIRQKYSFDLPSLSGIGYREVEKYLNGEMTLPEMFLILKRETHRYAKRQMTWFKRDSRISWIEKNDVSAARDLVGKFFNDLPLTPP